MDFGHWLYDGDEPFTDDTFGFVYLITNTINGRMYIGQKHCKRVVKYNPLKGKKRKRKIIKDSNWRTYSGSSRELLEDIEKYGINNFEHTIIHLCDSKWELNYLEIKEQLKVDALIDPLYYNGIVNVRIPKPPKAFLDKHGYN